MNAYGAFVALWCHLRTLWRLARECSSPTIWSCTLVEVGWTMFWASALGLVAVPLVASLFLIVAGLALLALAIQAAKTGSKIFPLPCFDGGPVP
jgi:hypothetical protein